MKKKSSAARESVTGIRARNPENKNAVREQILRNAIELYCETGYHGFSIRSLAERVGFSPSALYRYFSSKDEVFAGLVDLGFRLMEDQLGRVQADNIVDYLKAFAKAYLAFALAEPQLYRLMTTDHPPASVALSGDTTRRRWQVFAILGNNAQKFGLSALDTTPENTAATDVLWAFGHGLASLAISLPYFPPERVDRTLEYIFSQFTPFFHLLASQQAQPSVLPVK